MKTNLRLAAFLLAGAVSAAAATLSGTTAVHVRPDENSLVITYLKAGSEPVPAVDAIATTPAGWMAVEISGPFEGYVKNGDIMKNLDVKPGSPVYLTPKAGAPEFARFDATDKTDITGLHGKFTQVRLTKKLTGFIHVTSAASVSAPVAATPAAPPPTAKLVDVAPVAPVAYGVSTAGRPAPVVNLGDGGSSTLPRFFQGKFVSTRSAFKPRRPYDWALNDDAGVRYAYLDVSKLLLTEQIEKYIDHVVVVYGAGKSVPGTKDIVIEVESLQLK
ncbi:MAG TPA: hypothetical protein PLU52_07310 [Opitutaceae bacterium]|nr:hypothetical protein [Opitutaceae bacterium]HND60716.1 hypothetical protein [Opitutaceae bacterium]